ncbi:MAG: V-type ATP synthase subunit E [Candidatus Heimdallarchaeota archaeon]|nr:V-type ATP synthase subunit E [Candidatus Heimdallarchaeota archaeon]
MSDEYFNPEIVDKIRKNTDKLIKDIMASQKKAIDEIEKDIEVKILQTKNDIVEAANKKVEAEFLKEKAKQELDLRLKLTKFRDELVDEFIVKATEKIKSLTTTKEYEKSLENLLLTAILTLKESEVIVNYREQDKKILTKQFLTNITDKLEKENKLKTEIKLSNSFIESIGGLIIVTSDGKISINNTYEKRIERALGTIKRELSLMLIQEG